MAYFLMKEEVAAIFGQLLALSGMAAVAPFGSWRITGRAALHHDPPTTQQAMYNLTPWNPMRELEDFQSRILNAFRAPTGRRGEGNDELAERSNWSPAVNIAEDEAEYRISAELPGIKREDVKVTVENGVLTVRGERRTEEEVKGRRHHLVERSYGVFSRRFSLPADADSDQVNAVFKDGVLEIKLAKSETAKPKEIAVRDA